ncbi:hypothetical protein KFL_000350180 [Klebsormidium nitens]|uniref:RNA polymerase II-associated protein 3 n=1 Tax=Klebsormidium nitens TaxID=105231 RepID=A0A1Y1HNQ3_KLENI|nr:hypothetical protein KFL_000350180 [Klebsormidium nitens]|eukprot:GAQ79663.1 hypothetical protein KFL_000350180 [Klebsormidium nitens]
MADFFGSLNDGGAAEGGNTLNLSEKERREFDEITFDKIQALTDVNKLARLAAYMRIEDFHTTADVAQARLQNLQGSAGREENPVLPARKDADAELDKVLQELKSWEASVKGADKALKSDAPPTEEDAPPVRRHIGGKVGKAGLIEEPEETKPKNAKEVMEKAKRMKDAKDVRSGAEYYQKWDKVAENLEKEAEGSLKKAKPAASKPKTETEEIPEETSAPVLSAAAADRLVDAAYKKPVVERRWLANREREKGNELFKSKEYQGSIAAYTLAIRLLPSLESAFCNRAAAHLKLKQYKEAEADCTEALKIDPGYLKALRRRGMARLELGNAEGAIGDLETVQECEYDKELTELLRKARAKVGKKAGAEKPMRRMQIEEVEEEEGSPETAATEPEVRPETEQEAGRAGNGHVSAAAERTKAEEQQRAEKGGTNGDKKRMNAGSTGPEHSQSRETNGGARKDPSEASTGNAAEVKTKQNESDGSGKKEAGSPVVEASGKDGTAANGGASQKEADAARLAEEWREKGNVLYKRGDVTGAEACYSQSLTYSENAAALSNRAMCRNRFGRFREAEEDASAAIIADPTYVKAYHRRAAARRGLHKKEQAMEDYKVVLQAMPNNVGLQEEIRSLQSELEDSMYIPPRRGAPVIEEVEEEAPAATTPVPPKPAQNMVKPPVSDARKPKPNTKPAEPAKTSSDEKPAFEGAQPSPRKAQRIPRPTESISSDGIRPESDEKAESPEKVEEMQAEGQAVGSMSKGPEQAEEGASLSKSKEGAAQETEENRPAVREKPAPKESFPSVSAEKEVTPEEIPPASKSSAAESGRKEEAEREKEAGNRLFKARDVAGALKHYSRAIELQPGNAAFYGNRAMCYLQLKEYEKVVKDSSRALELDPGYTKAYYRRALARKGLGQYEAALEDLKFVQEKLPKDKQVTEEVLAITDLYMRRFENLTSAPPVSSPTAPASREAPAGGNNPQGRSPPAQKTTEPSVPAKTVLPTWLKEQLAEQVKQGALKKDETSGVPAPPKSSSENEPPSGGVARNVGSLTDEVFESRPSFFESNGGKAQFSAGSFDKKAVSPKTSPRGALKKRASPRSVVTTATEAKTPPNEPEEETLAATPPEKIARVRGVGSVDSKPPSAKQGVETATAPASLAGNGASRGVENGGRVEAEEARQGVAASSTPKVERESAEGKALPAKPRSALEFERACASLGKPERIAAYLQIVGPASYPSIIKENLSAVLMTHIGSALSALPAKTSADVMSGLADVSRFKLVWMLLPPATKKNYAAALTRGRTEDVSPELQQKVERVYR